MIDTSGGMLSAAAALLCRGALRPFEKSLGDEIATCLLSAALLRRCSARLAYESSPRRRSSIRSHPR